jgi:hypothetical protein
MKTQEALAIADSGDRTLDDPLVVLAEAYRRLTKGLPYSFILDGTEYRFKYRPTEVDARATLSPERASYFLHFENVGGPLGRQLGTAEALGNGEQICAIPHTYT